MSNYIYFPQALLCHSKNITISYLKIVDTNFWEVFRFLIARNEGSRTLLLKISKGESSPFSLWGVKIGPFSHSVCTVPSHHTSPTFHLLLPRHPPKNFASTAGVFSISSLFLLIDCTRSEWWWRYYRLALPWKQTLTARLSSSKEMELLRPLENVVTIGLLCN